jgi:hypothetical protein
MVGKLIVNSLLLLMALVALVPTAAKPNIETPSDTTYPFEFHNNFWLNLHHFLYEQATLRAEAAKVGKPNDAAASLVNQVSSEERRRWESALDYYTKTLITHDLMADGNLVNINNRLSEAEGAGDLNKTQLDTDLRTILESVEPTYRKHWWPQHEQMNRFWIAIVKPMVLQFNQVMINQLTNAFKATWPSKLIQVDVVEYANWAGAYTTIDYAKNQVRVTIASNDPGSQGFAALEAVFHEASHSMVFPRNGRVAEAIARGCKAKNKPTPNGLWHAIIFYTVGEITKRNLARYGVTDYTPVGYRGLYARAWPNFQKPLELYWQPYLEGKIDFDQAVINLINAL